MTIFQIVLIFWDNNSGKAHKHGTILSNTKSITVCIKNFSRTQPAFSCFLLFAHSNIFIFVATNFLNLRPIGEDKNSFFFDQITSSCSTETPFNCKLVRKEPVIGKKRDNFLNQCFELLKIVGYFCDHIKRCS